MSYGLESVPRAVFKRQLGFHSSYKKPVVDSQQLLQYLQCSGEDVARVAENEENLFDQIPIYDIKFCPVQFHPHFMAVTDELGYVTIVNATIGLVEEDKIILKEKCHDNALFNMDWSPHTDGVLATCAGDQLVKVWDIRNDFGNIALFKGHSRTVKSVRFHPSNDTCLISGGRDGTVRCWDSRCGESAINVIRNAHGQSNDQVSVTDIVFQDDCTIITCGAKDGMLRMWDLRKTYSGLKKITPVSTFGVTAPLEVKGFHSLCLDIHNNLYASTFHEVLKFNLSGDMSKPEPARFVAPDTFNSYVKINTSPDGRYLISGSSMSESYLWDTWDSSEKPFLVLKCTSSVTRLAACVATFSPYDSLTVVSGNDEGRVFIWRPDFNPEKDPNKSILASKLSTEESDLISVHANRVPSKLHEINTHESLLARLRSGTSCFYPVNNVVSRSNVAPKETWSVGRELDMRSLLNNLPNFVMDGTHPSLPRKTPKVAARTSCWLGGLTRKLVIKNRKQTAEKRQISALTTTDVNTQENQAKKMKLKPQQILTPKSKASKPRTPNSSRLKGTPTSSNASPATPRGGGKLRRNSVDATNQGKASPQSILKYFTVDRTFPSQSS